MASGICLLASISPRSFTGRFRGAIRGAIVRDLARDPAEASSRRARGRRALAEAIAQARREGLCERAWLFGSYAWGWPGARSDVDLFVDECDDPEALAAVIGRLTETDVHVIPCEGAQESLRDRAMSEGERL